MKWLIRWLQNRRYQRKIKQQEEKGQLQNE